MEPFQKFLNWNNKTRQLKASLSLFGLANKFLKKNIAFDTLSIGWFEDIAHGCKQWHVVLLQKFQKTPAKKSARKTLFVKNGSITNVSKKINIQIFVTFTHFDTLWHVKNNSFSMKFKVGLSRLRKFLPN